VSGNALWLPRTGLVGFGGNVGLTLLQEESAFGRASRVATNPMFFDINAGAAYVLDANDPLLLRLSAGFGKEHGAADDWRFFWRIGAALELNRTPSTWNVGGAGTLTFGVRR
jgi:hypothetical protein